MPGSRGARRMDELAWWWGGVAAALRVWGHLAGWRMQTLCSGCRRIPSHLQLTNAQFQKVKSIKGADFTDALVRKDIQASLCKIAGAARG